ncbi:MAG: winged helix-turn-helix domain-containing protein [Caulobacterales bacterium]
MLPVLEVAADGQDRAGSALIAAMADRFGLTEAERPELLPSGRQPTIANRRRRAHAGARHRARGNHSHAR